ncbi:MAG: hypothetical protein ACOYOK_13310 [Pseudobdellovibrionaceae bacterium]
MKNLFIVSILISSTVYAKVDAECVSAFKKVNSKLTASSINSYCTDIRKSPAELARQNKASELKLANKQNLKKEKVSSETNSSDRSF